MSKAYPILVLAAMVLSIGACSQGETPPAAKAADPAPAPAINVASAASEVTEVEVVEPVELNIPEVVAKVDGKPIPGSELQSMIEQTTKMMQARGMESEVGEVEQRGMLENIIDRKVLLTMAEKAGVTLTDEEVNAALDEQKSRMPSPEMFTNLLKQMGMSEEDAKDQIRKGLTIDKYADQATKDLTVTDEELTKEYEELKAQGRLEEPEKVDVSHILIKVDEKDEAKADAAWAAGKEKIDAARKRVVEGGEAFGDVAKEVSEDPGSAQKGGSYTEVPHGQMVPEFDQTMFATKVGEVSEPFKTNYGWHILTVDAKHEAGTKPMEEIREPLENFVLNKKKTEAMQKLVEEARAKLKVEVLYLADVDPDAPEEGAEAAESAEAEGAEAAEDASK